MRKASKGQINHETLVEYCIGFIDDNSFLDDQKKFKKKDKEWSEAYSVLLSTLRKYAPFKDQRPPPKIEQALRHLAITDAQCWRLAKMYLKWLSMNEIQIDKEWNLLLYLMLQNSMPDHLHERGNRETDRRNDCIRALDHILKTKFNLDLLGSSKNEDRLPYRAEIISDVLGRVASVKLRPEGVKKIIQRT